MSDTISVETKEGKKISGNSLQVIIYSVVLSLASSFVSSNTRVATVEADVKHIVETQSRFENTFVTNRRFDDLVKTADKIDTKLDYIITHASNEN